MTATYIAASNGHLECLMHLSNYKADVDTEVNGKNALQIAFEKGHEDCFKFLEIVSKSNKLHTYQYPTDQNLHIVLKKKKVTKLAQSAKKNKKCLPKKTICFSNYTLFTIDEKMDYLCILLT